jgi:hypothetical protein
MRDQFVILIGERFHIPLTAESAGVAASPAAASRPRKAPRGPPPPAARRARVAGGNIRSRQTIRRDVCSERTHICCNFLTGWSLSICDMPAALRISFTERSRPTPQGRTVWSPLALPPGEGGPLISVRGLRPASRFPASRFPVHWRDDPHTPECGLRPRRAGSRAFGRKSRVLHPGHLPHLLSGSSIPLRLIDTARAGCRDPRALPGAGEYEVQEGDGARLGQRGVAVAALWGLDAGGAARLARAGADRGPGGG